MLYIRLGGGKKYAFKTFSFISIKIHMALARPFLSSGTLFRLLKYMYTYIKIGVGTYVRTLKRKIDNSFMPAAFKPILSQICE